jgi:hypothetical protein
MSMVPRWNDIYRESKRTRKKTCPSATLTTTNPKLTYPAGTWASILRSQRLTAWAVARPSCVVPLEATNAPLNNGHLCLQKTLCRLKFYPDRVAAHNALKLYRISINDVPRILNLASVWMWVVTFTLYPPNLRGKETYVSSVQARRVAASLWTQWWRESNLGPTARSLLFYWLSYQSRNIKFTIIFFEGSCWPHLNQI